MVAKKAAGVTIGFAGTGEADVDGMVDILMANLEDLDPEAPLRLIFPVTTDLLTPELEGLVEFIQKNADNGLEYEAVTTAKDAKSPSLKSALAGASKKHTVTDVLESLLSLLVEAPGPLLYIIEPNEEVAELLGTAEEESIPVFDLADGLRQVQMAFDQETLEGMEAAELKAIAVGLGIEKPPRAKAALIEAILEAQGGDVGKDTADDAAVPDEEPEEVPEEDATEDETELVPTSSEEVIEVIRELVADFTAALFEILVAPVETETEPEPEPEPAPRRRGRPPKVAPEPEEAPAPPRRRGRPPKAAAEAPAAPARRRMAR